MWPSNVITGKRNVIISEYTLWTSMHSSRMRTARLLPVSPSMHCSRGVSAPGGGHVCWGYVCSEGGVSACRGGICSHGGVCPRVSLLLGGGALPRHPPVDTILDTRFWKYYLAPTSLRAVININTPCGHLPICSVCHLLASLRLV